jgi:hypothetical protein
MIECSPDTCSITDHLGWLAIHVAVSKTDASAGTSTSAPRFILKNTGETFSPPRAEIIQWCIDAYPKSAETATKQGYLALQLYLRSRNFIDMKIVRILLDVYPFSAFVATGEQKELLLHTVVNQDSPCLELVESLVRINPEGCIHQSASTSWATGATPYQIVYQRALRDIPSYSNAMVYNESDSPVICESDIWWKLTRLILLANKDYNRPLLMQLNWEFRKKIIICLSTYRRKNFFVNDECRAVIDAAEKIVSSDMFATYMYYIYTRCESTAQLIVSFM